MPTNPSAEQLAVIPKETTGTPSPSTQDNDWLSLAQQAYTSAWTFKEANIRNQVERNLALFQSKHPSGSKYHSDTYKYRSKLFRPKTRSMIRRSGAAAAVAYFSSADLVNTEAPNPNDEMQVMGAEVVKELMNHRLNNTIPWFLTCMGAYQDAQVQGVCLSYNFWEYKEIEEEQEQMDPQGNPVMDQDGKPVKNKVKRVIKDHPVIKLIPIENLLIEPSADWDDPINTSAYLIHLIPMRVYEVKARMRMKEGKLSEPKWKMLTDAEISSAAKMDNDPTRQSRERRQDSKSTTTYISDYDIVWVRRTIMVRDDQDYVFYTLGGSYMLTDPVPLEEAYFHGKRPFTYGVCELETHKLYPSGKPELGEGLQMAANDTLNQRMDNVKLAMNKRTFVRRNSDTDIQTLKKSVPGSVIQTNDPEHDIINEQVNDVTGSSYKEQELLNLDFDELLGTFSASSIQSSRKVGETVGGMQLLADDADNLTEYDLRVFTETWVEPTMKQLALLEQHYESDQVILALVGEKLKIPEITPEMIMQDVYVRVNVGFGATNPEQRVKKLVYGVNAVAQMAPALIQKVKGEEVLKEVFGSLGYKDGSRFFDLGENPELAQYEQQIQELQQELQSRQLEVDGRIQQEKIRAEANYEIARMKGQVEFKIARMEHDLEFIEKQLKAEQNANDRAELVLEKEALVNNIQTEKARLHMDKQNSLAEVIQNDRYQSVPGARY